MKRRRLNTKSNLYSYLKSSGVLENGTHEEIQKVKKEYWKQYKRNGVIINEDKTKRLPFLFQKMNLEKLQLNQKT